jgi:hypothetical protein
VRSTSTSQLSAKELRYEQSEREPVDLAMQQKAQRLARLSLGTTPQGRTERRAGRGAEPAPPAPHPQLWLNGCACNIIARSQEQQWSPTKR